MKSFTVLLVSTALILCALVHVESVHAVKCPPPSGCSQFDGSWIELNSCSCLSFTGVSVPIFMAVVNPVKKSIGSISVIIGAQQMAYSLQSSLPDGFVNTFTLEKTENFNVLFQNNGTQTIQLALYYPGSPAVGYFVKGQVPQLKVAVPMNMEPLSSAMRWTGASYELFNFCANGAGKVMTYALGNGIKTYEFFGGGGCQYSEPENYMGSLVYIVNLSNIKGATVRAFNQML